MSTTNLVPDARGDLRGPLSCAFAMTILGASMPVSRLILDYPVLIGQAGRYAVAVTIFLVIIRLRRDPFLAGLGPLDLVRIAALAASGLVLFNLLLLVSLDHADPAVLGSVVGGTPLFLALIGPLLSGRRPAAALLLAAAVVIAGGALVHGGGRADAVGLLAALGTMACEVSFSLLAVPLLPRIGPIRVSALSCAAAVPMFLSTALVTGEMAAARPPTGSELLAYAYLGAPLTVIAFVFWYSGLGRLGPARAGLFIGVLPPVTLVVTSVLDSRPPGVIQTAGVLVVAGGLVLGMRPPPAPAPAPSAATTVAARALDEAHEVDASAARNRSR